MTRTLTKLTLTLTFALITTGCFDRGYQGGGDQGGCTGGSSSPCSSDSDRYSDNGDDTIWDDCLGVFWADRVETEYLTWDQAAGFASGFSLAGKSNWRLPDYEEALSIIDNQAPISGLWDWNDVWVDCECNTTNAARLEAITTKEVECILKDTEQFVILVADG